MEIENFKTFKGKTEITFSPKFNIIVGLNGSGKTNLLEAICFGLGKEVDKKAITVNQDFAKVTVYLSNGEKISQKITRADYMNNNKVNYANYDDLNVKIIDNFGCTLNEKDFKEYGEYIKKCSNEIQIIAAGLVEYFTTFADKVINLRIHSFLI